MSDVQDQLAELDEDINAIGLEIHTLKQHQKELMDRRRCLQDRQMQTSQHLPDYQNTTFPWTNQLYYLAHRYWNISSFRSLQLPIMNAALDRKRDVFVVLPTGGGKSLCYQLPALVDSGFTLVVSPLVSLIKDQVYHLRRANIPSDSLTGSTTKQEVDRIQTAMKNKPASFKLLYVTPEKIANSKTFMSKLENAYNAGQLNRIVIDEAHCCSQQGHDFRPDYKKLNILRKAFPKTPIMALTATCPWLAMKDVMHILGMKEPTAILGTLVYSAPLYRPNLVYKVLPKPESQEDQLKCMVDWIINNHPTSAGIIYCLTKKETSMISGAVYKHSNGQIQCGCYHSDMTDDDKELTHRLWRQRKLQVIVATIAFGMGINHLETRFVMHHTVSKSVEGYYQESGRAGRDGERADCVLYYRGQDAFRLSTMTVSEIHGRENLNAIVRYAQNYTMCRKIFFEKYFEVDTSRLQQIHRIDNRGGGNSAMMNTTTPDVPCGNCDNCLRDPSTVVVENIGKEMVTLVMILKNLRQLRQRVTMGKLISTWQGKGLKALHLESLAQHPNVAIPVDRKFTMVDLENIINHLLTQGYLMDDYHFTSHSTYTYIVPGPKVQKLVLGNDPSALDIKMEFIRKKQSPTTTTTTNSITTTKKRTQPTTSRSLILPNKKIKSFPASHFSDMIILD